MGDLVAGDIKRDSIRNILMWIALVVGIICLAFCALVAITSYFIFQPFGGIPWSWNYIHINAGLFAIYFTFLGLGIGLMVWAICSYRGAKRRAVEATAAATRDAFS